MWKQLIKNVVDDQKHDIKLGLAGSITGVGLFILGSYLDSSIGSFLMILGILLILIGWFIAGPW